MTGAFRAGGMALTRCARAGALDNARAWRAHYYLFSWHISYHIAWQAANVCRLPPYHRFLLPKDVAQQAVNMAVPHA